MLWQRVRVRQRARVDAQLLHAASSVAATIGASDVAASVSAASSSTTASRASAIAAPAVSACSVSAAAHAASAIAASAYTAASVAASAHAAAAAADAAPSFCGDGGRVPGWGYGVGHRVYRRGDGPIGGALLQQRRQLRCFDLPDFDAVSDGYRRLERDLL